MATLTNYFNTGTVTLAGVAAASKTLVSSANYANTETVTLNGKVYTFVTAIGTTEGNVLVGVSEAASMANLVSAITHVGGTPGTNYVSAAVHPTMTAATDGVHTITLTAKTTGPAGNALTLAETCANAAFAGGATTLSDGSDGQTVVGTGTGWLGAIRANDLFRHAGLTERILEVTDATHLTLAQVWPGDSFTDDIYEVEEPSPSADLTLDVRTLVESINDYLVNPHFQGDMIVDDSATIGTDLIVSGNVLFKSTTPGIQFYAPDATFTDDQNRWDITTADGVVNFRFVNDDGTDHNNFMTAARSGAAVNHVDFGGQVTAPSFMPTGSTMPVDGIYESASHTLSIASNNSKVASFADGGTVMGAPTGGAQGSGSINAQALYVNGVAVGAAATFIYNKYTDTATAAQTVFTHNYTPGYLEVFLDGSKLSADQYTATNGTTITLGTAAELNQTVEIIAWSVLSLTTPIFNDSVTFQDGGVWDENGINTANRKIVRVVATANVTIASALISGSVIDGVTLTTGNRVLLAAQTTASQNGIYDVAPSGAASRSGDSNVSLAMMPGLQVYVSEGTARGGTNWTLTSAGPITLGTTSLAFSPDMEKGTFHFADGSGASLNFSGSTLSYCRVGKVVTITGTLSYPSTANGSNARWTGLPFPFAAAGAFFYPITSSSLLLAAVDAAGTAATLFKAGVGNFVNSDLSGINIILSFSYVTS